MTMSPTVADALAGARYRVPAAADSKSVMVAGAAGRLRERVLARVLGMREYRRIYVLASEAMHQDRSLASTFQERISETNSC